MSSEDNMPRKQIALLVDQPENNFSIEICKGAIAAARHQDIELYIIYGGFVKENSQDFEYQNNNAFPLAKKADTAIISIASIAYFAQGKKYLLDLYDHTQLITLNDSYPDISSVSYSPDDGLRDALYYMIHFLNKKNLIMIGGPVFNLGSNRRINIFKEVMQENNLLKEDHQIFHAVQKNRHQADLIEKFMDEAGEVDAVVCANDELAIAVYEVLQRRNLQVGTDVAVLGFDDIAEASRMNPPLASIKAPAYMLGYHAVNMACEQKDNHEVSKLQIPSFFVARDSLGFCDSAEKRLHTSLDNLLKKHAPFDEIWNTISNTLTTGNYHIATTQTYKKLRSILFSIYSLDFTVLHQQDVFPPLFQEIYDLIENEETLSIGRQQICYVLRCFTENLVQNQTYTDISQQTQASQFCDRLSHTCIRALDTGFLHKEQQYQHVNKALNIAAKRLMLFTTTNECYRNILETLRDFKITDGSLFLFEKPLRNVHMDQLKDRTIRYAGKLDENGIELFSNRKLKVEDILSSLSGSSSKVTAILSIYTQEDLYGYLACELNHVSAAEIEFLRVHIGTALHTLRLIESIERQSETDPLTYLYNRRGFYHNVYDFIDRISNQQLWIIYADMNRLKIINDVYGHDEGDMAIVKGAAILKEAFPINSIISRMGGDEFLVITGFSSDTTEKDIEALINQKTDIINTRIQREINVSLSCGILKINQSDQRLLDEMINDADTLMYHNKHTH